MPKDMYGNSDRKVKGGKGFPLKRGASESKVEQTPVSGCKYGTGDAAKDVRMSGDGLAKYVKAHKKVY